jgi:acetyl esterase/lipase
MTNSGVIKDNVIKEDITIKVDSNNSISLRVYKRKTVETELKRRPVYVWFHGGGFLFGSLDGEDGHCFNIVQNVDVIVVHICYRHTPEYLWPVPREDGLAGLNWVFEHIDELGGDPKSVVVSGRSAGGLLTAIVALQDREQV